MKLCECGCGQPAPIANHTRRALGHVKGQPIRFIRGHNGHREDADPVQRGRREAEKRYPIEGLCENGCGRPAADRHHIDGNTANNAPENIRRLCRRCHMKLDGRLHQGHQRARGEASGKAKVTEADVLAIRAARPATPLAVLAKRYGIAQSTVSAIACGRLWSHV
jgi:hypothetical protein